MILTLLCVSSLPMTSIWACEMPMLQQQSSYVEETQDMPCECRCACSLESHVDGLPHQLSPHILATSGKSLCLTSFVLIHANSLYLSEWQALLDSPPPKLV